MKNSIQSWHAVFFDYLIALSALASTFGGIVRPICLAAFRLMMNSNFFGCSSRRIELNDASVKSGVSMLTPATSEVIGAQENTVRRYSENRDERARCGVAR